MLQGIVLIRRSRYTGRSKFAAACVSLIGVTLLLANIHGVLFSPYDRPDEAGDWQEAVASIDRAQRDYANTRSGSYEFFQEATRAYATAIKYEWPKHRARVAFTDNWILWSMRFVDPLLAALDLTNVEGLFRAYETIDYRRALARGYGICSQNALGFASLLKRRYDIEADVIGLEGHVVVEAKGYLLDPSVGLALPFDLAEAETSEERSGRVSAIYADAFKPDDVTRVFGFDGEEETVTRFAALGQYYDPSGNQRLEGPRGYRSKLYWFERASDWAKWIVPGILLLVGYLTLFGKRRGAMRPLGG